MTENKGDLISREALKKWIDDSVSQYGNQYSTDILNMFGLFREIINNAPTVEQTIVTEFKGCDNCELERPKGEWLIEGGTTLHYVCSKCDCAGDVWDKFCKHCGADMRGGGKK